MRNFCLLYTSQECNNVTTPLTLTMVPVAKWEVVAYKRFQTYMYYTIKCTDLTWKLLVFWKTGHEKEVASYKRWSLTRGSKHTDLTWKLWYFGKLVTRDDHNRRFHHTIHILQVDNERVFCSCNNESWHIWLGPSSQASSGTHLSHNISHSKNIHYFKVPPGTTQS